MRTGWSRRPPLCSFCVSYVSPHQEHFDPDSASDGSVGSAALQLRYNDGTEHSAQRCLTPQVVVRSNASSPDFFEDALNGLVPYRR